MQCLIFRCSFKKTSLSFYAIIDDNALFCRIIFRLFARFLIDMAKNTQISTSRTFNKVTVSVDKGVLRLQFPNKLVNALKVNGVKFSRYKSLGKREIEPSTGISNRPWAEAIASRIQSDLDHPDSLFDPTLVKYLDVKVDATITLKTQDTHTLSVGQLWEDFMSYHLPGKSAGTKYRYQNDCVAKLKPFWDCPIDRETAHSMRAAFLEKPSSAAKLAMQLLTKAVNWAVEEEKIFVSKNPFGSMAESLKGGQTRLNKLTGLPTSYVAFTQKEVRMILDAYLGDSINSRYHDFFKFKFLTGCRTGEAIALTWDDVKFQQGVISFNKTHDSRTGVSKGTKTQDSRIFPMNSYLSDWLSALKALSNADLIFPAITSKYMSRSNASKSWSANSDNPSARTDGIVFSLAKQGKLQYLPPYNTRHTFINFCIDQGIDTITIADWCGNSDSVIEQVYRSRKRDVDIELLPKF